MGLPIIKNNTNIHIVYARYYNPRIEDPKIEEFPCLVLKLSVTLTALQYKLQ